MYKWYLATVLHVGEHSNVCVHEVLGSSSSTNSSRIFFKPLVSCILHPSMTQLLSSASDSTWNFSLSCASKKTNSIVCLWGVITESRINVNPGGQLLHQTIYCECCNGERFLLQMLLWWMISINLLRMLLWWKISINLPWMLLWWKIPINLLHYTVFLWGLLGIATALCKSIDSIDRRRFHLQS